MNSSYTAIEPDEPLDSPPSYSANDHNTTTNTTTSNPLTQPYVNQPQADQPQQPGTSSLFEPRTLLQRLKRIITPNSITILYIFPSITNCHIYIWNHSDSSIHFKNTFILHFIVLILLVAGDFWNLKNISGRLLVGLRWWNETTLIESENGNGNGNASGQVGESAKDFENVWVFETADPNRYINPIDSKVFWLLLYGQPVAWVVLGVLAV